MIIQSEKIASNPVVSVLVRTYNHEKYLRCALDSLVSQQTNFPFEIVIGDDCSTDATSSICKEYQEKHPTCIKVILQEKNKGIAENYNDILRQCQGRYIATCDGDDFWCDTEKLQKHVDYMEQHPSVVITYHDAKPVDAENTIGEETLLPTSRKKDFSSDDLQRGKWILPVTMCYRRDVIPEILLNMTSRVFNEDVFIISLAGQFGRGAYLETIAPSAYRQTDAGIWSQQSDVHRSLMAAGSNAELMLYYKKKSSKELFLFFKQKLLTSLSNCIGSKSISERDMSLFVTLLKRYWRYIGLRNLLYYLRNKK